MDAKDIRQIFTSRDFQGPTNQSMILQVGINPSELSVVYSLPFIVTKEIKLSMFQFKIIHNILPLKSYLFKIGVAENNNCPFCFDREKHTCTHFFFHCKKAQSFWDKFKAWWLEISSTPKLELEITSALILYGYLTNVKKNILINHLILIAKQNMFNVFINDECYTFQTFLNHATTKFDFEKKIVSSKSKRDQLLFEKKWSPFTKFLSKNTSKTD